MEKRYAYLIKNISDVIIETGLSAKINYVSPQIENLLGYTPEKLIGKDSLKLVDSQYIPIIKEAMEEALSLGKDINVELSLIHKNGNRVIVSSKGSSIKRGENEVLIIFLRDITKDKENAQTIKASEKKYQSLFKNIPYCIILINTEGVILDSNPAVKELLGYSKREVINKNFLDLPIYEPEMVEILRKRLKIYAEGFKLNPIELKLFKKNGEFIWVNPSVNLINIGNLIAIQIIFRDISLKKEAEKRLKESEKKYRSILESINEGYFETDKQGKFTFLNKAAYQSLGYSKKELLEKSYLNLIGEEDSKKLKKIFKEIIKKGKGNSDVETGVYKKNGDKIIVESSFNLKFDDLMQFKGFYGLARDTTEKKETRKALKQAYEKENFYRTLFTHDISNILNNLSSSSFLLSLYLETPEKMQDINDIIMIIKDQVKRGIDLVSNVRALSQLDGSEISLKPINCVTVIKEASKSVLKDFPQKEINIEYEFVDSEHYIIANNLLRNVIENILINAIRHNLNTNIKISIDLSKIKRKDKNFIKFQFKDNGYGVPDEIKDIIFKKGHKEKKNTRGMGLGLSLVKKILESYDGNIYVKDKVEGDYSKGSNFIILIPEVK